MAESALALDPLAEGGYRQAIIAHVALGDRARAARLFDDCTGLLDRELGVEPSPESGAALGTSRGG